MRVVALKAWICRHLIWLAFLSPKESRIDIVQAAGRAMRKDDGKERGYILVPLYVAVTEGETLDEAVERARFGTVLEVLQALKEQDEALADEIREMVQPMTPRSEEVTTGGRENDASRLGRPFR